MRWISSNMRFFSGCIESLVVQAQKFAQVRHDSLPVNSVRSTDIGKRQRPPQLVDQSVRRTSRATADLAGCSAKGLPTSGRISLGKQPRHLGQMPIVSGSNPPLSVPRGAADPVNEVSGFGDFIVTEHVRGAGPVHRPS